MRNDPLAQGPGCSRSGAPAGHSYDGHDGLGGELAEPPTAPDLEGFASREWLTALLHPERVAPPEYFGGTAFARGRMLRMVQSRIAGLDETGRVDLAKVVKSLSAVAAVDEAEREEIAEGVELLSAEGIGCTECHEWRATVERSLGPLLTAFGSREWLEASIQDASHTRFYGERNDRMPAFGPDEILSEVTVGLLVGWLRGDWKRVLGS